MRPRWTGHGETGGWFKSCTCAEVEFAAWCHGCMAFKSRLESDAVVALVEEREGQPEAVKPRPERAFRGGTLGH